MPKLSEKDLALLSTIVYCDYIVEHPDGAGLQNIVAEMLADDFDWDKIEFVGDFNHLLQYKDKQGENGREAAIARFKEVLEEVKKSEGLEHLIIKNPRYGKGSASGITAACFVDSSDNTATVAFRGTDGTYEAWMDNFEGAGRHITLMQEAAKTYMDDLSEYSDITVTGHSKGGNLAAYVTIECNKVNRCVSFDGQGFSNDFHIKHETQIEKNESKIKTIAAYNDPVNVLLISVSGETVYVNNDMRNTGDIFEGHYITNIIFDRNFDKNGNLIAKREQDPLIKALGFVINDVLLRLVPDEYMEWFADTFLSIVAYFIADNGDFDDIIDVAHRLISGAIQNPKLFTSIIVVALVLAAIAAVVYIRFKDVVLIVKAMQKVIETAMKAAEAIGKWAVEMVKSIQNAIINFCDAISNWWNNTFNPGSKYTADNPNFKVDTERLRDYATRIDKLNNRLNNLDGALRGLYWQVGLLDIWDIVVANWLTRESSTLDNIVSYLNKAADCFEAAENKAREYMGG